MKVDISKKHTFVVCAYKESQYLEECIQSVLNQNVKSKVIISTGTPNSYIKEIAEKYGCRYLDCNEALVDEHGEQKSEYAIDGVHMYANGYLNVFKSLKPYL